MEYNIYVEKEPKEFKAVQFIYGETDIKDIECFIRDNSDFDVSIEINKVKDYKQRQYNDEITFDYCIMTLSDKFGRKPKRHRLYDGDYIVIPDNKNVLIRSKEDFQRIFKLKDPENVEKFDEQYMMNCLKDYKDPLDQMIAFAKILKKKGK